MQHCGFTAVLEIVWCLWHAVFRLSSSAKAAARPHDRQTRPSGGVCGGGDVLCGGAHAPSVRGPNAHVPNGGAPSVRDPNAHVPSGHAPNVRVPSAHDDGGDDGRGDGLALANVLQPDLQLRRTAHSMRQR